MRNHRKILSGASFMALAATLTSPALAQDQAAPADTDEYEEIIVTGTAGGAALRKQDASFAITSVSADDLAAAAPKSTAEIFTLVPGVWAESSGGKGGANIDVRGLPAGGDAPFVTLSVAGAPIFGTPTLSFLEQSTIFRVDDTIASVEALRGGPSAVFARGEPGVTLNFRLKEGKDETEGGVRFTSSDYDLQQVDFFLSGALGKDLYYTVGGYASTSPGIRDAQFNSERGFQLSGNLTYHFDRGKISAWTRQTDDVGQWYLPIALNAGLDLGTFSPLGNATRLREIQVDADGNTKIFDFRRGRGWKGNLSGLNVEFEVSDNITLRNNLAYLKGDADTYGLVPSGAAVTAGAVSAVTGNPVETVGGVTLADGDFVQTYGHWVVEKDLESLTNDLSLAFDLGSNEVTIGYYRSSFSSDDWWSLGNPVGLQLTRNGDMLANVTPADIEAAGGGAGFAFGLQGAGDANINAVYLADSFDVTDKLRIDAGIRNEWVELNYVVDTGPGFPDGTRDRNIHYTKNEFSYTAAANYAFSDTFGAFVRFSDGETFPNFDTLRDGVDRTFDIKQLEAGLKYTSDHVRLYATGFRNTNERFQSTLGANDATVFKTRSYGLELDSTLVFGAFNLATIATLQDATITENEADPTLVGNRVHRQPRIQVRVAPSFDFEVGDWNANLYAAAQIVGNRFENLANTVELGSYTKVDLGVKVDTPSGLYGQVHADNLFDSHGLTEGDPRSATAPNGRPILGRSFRFSVGFRF